MKSNERQICYGNRLIFERQTANFIQLEDRKFFQQHFLFIESGYVYCVLCTARTILFRYFDALTLQCIQFMNICNVLWICVIYFICMKLFRCSVFIIFHNKFNTVDMMNSLPPPQFFHHHHRRHHHRFPMFGRCRCNTALVEKDLVDSVEEVTCSMHMRFGVSY